MVGPLFLLSKIYMMNSCDYIKIILVYKVICLYFHVNINDMSKTTVKAVRMDNDLIVTIFALCEKENHNFSNMAETLLKEAVLNRANKSKK